MDSDPVSRRTFLGGTGALAGSSLLKGGIAGLLSVATAACTARDEGAAFEILSVAEAAEFEAIAARIVPATDTPGAREAGVIYFLDKSFGSIMEMQLAGARHGLAAFQGNIPVEYPGARAFADLDADDQDRYLATQENSGFFQLMRFMTIAGFFAMSSHGGNRDDIGWKLLGLDHQHHSWQPPFGYYDAAYTRKKTRGG